MFGDIQIWAYSIIVDCMLVCRQYNSRTKDLKISGEEVVSQHYLLIIDFLITEVKFKEKKLKDEIMEIERN